MIRWSVHEVVDIVKGNLLAGNPEYILTGVSTDSRHCKEGDLFIALKGEKFDGHDFVSHAINNGALGCVVQKAVNASIPGNAALILVKDTLHALGMLARYHRSFFKGPLVGVTGSNGKTTTKDMIASILCQKWVTLKTQGNFNNEIGMPLTLLRLGPETEAAVVEFGMRNIGQIKNLADIALPTAAVLTNIGEAHIEILGSKEAIAGAKGELIEAIPEEGFVLLNADDKYMVRQAARAKCRIKYYGIKGSFANPDYWAEEIESDGQCQKYILRTASGMTEVSLPLPGLHNVYNSLAAAGVCLELGQDFSDVICGLKDFTPTEKRLNIIKRDEYTIIDDTYNASPTSTIAALQILHDYPGRKKIAVLGDMLELGEYARDGHRLVGEKITQLKIDAVYTFGKMAKEITDVVSEKLGTIYSRNFTAKEDLISLLKSSLEAGNIYLVKGSRGMKMEEIVKALKGEA